MFLRTLICIAPICLLWLTAAFEAAASLCTSRPLPDRCLESLPAEHWGRTYRLKPLDPARYLEAAQNCAPAIRQSPNNTSLRVAVATVLFNAGKREEAGRLLSAPDLENDPLTLYSRADFLYRAWNGRDKLPEMVRLAERAVAAGSPDAVVLLGYAYEEGIVWQADEGAAYFLYLKAARQGCAEGMVKVGMYRQFGTYVERNWEKALKWYLRAAEAGDAFGMFRAGYVYDEGPEKLRDTARAIAWYRRSARLGFEDAMLNLGWMYRHGKGVRQDYRRALYWYRKSYRAGVRHALNNLGVMYLNGLGVGKDTRRARAYFLAAAADRKNVAAMRNLGYRYGLSGSPANRSGPAAYFWLYAAYRRTDDAGIRADLRPDLIDRQRDLSPTEARRIRKDAVNWLNGGALWSRYRKGIPDLADVGPP